MVVLGPVFVFETREGDGLRVEDQVRQLLTDVGLLLFVAHRSKYIVMDGRPEVIKHYYREIK